MQEFEFKKDLDEMNDAELRATLREFRSNYADAKEDYDSLQNKVEEYKEDLESEKERTEVLDELHPKFASMFAEMKDLDEEIVQDKFGVNELADELEEANAFQLETIESDSEAEAEEEDESTFNEREQKSRRVEEGSKYQDRIDRFMDGRVRTY